MSIRFGRSGNGYDSSQVMETLDDDWRLVTDPAARRKIQNRLAQRNYRQKLRNKIQQLEAGVTGDTASVISAPKPKKPKATSTSTSISTSTLTSTSTATAGRVTKRGRANSAHARTVTSRTNDEWRTQHLRRKSTNTIRSCTSSSSESSPITPTVGGFEAFPFPPHSGLRNYYSSGNPSLLLTNVDTPMINPTTRGFQDIDVIWAPEFQHGSYTVSSPLQQQQTIRPISGYIHNDRTSPINTQLPVLPVTYAIDPTTYYTESPIPHDEFCVSLDPSMNLGKFVNMEEAAMMKPEPVSPFLSSGTWGAAAQFQDLENIQRQMTIPQNSYIDAMPFTAIRGPLLDIAPECDRTSNFMIDEKISSSTHETWGYYGSPWEMARSYEAVEELIR